MAIENRSPPPLPLICEGLPNSVGKTTSGSCWIFNNGLNPNGKLCAQTGRRTLAVNNTFSHGL